MPIYARLQAGETAVNMYLSTSDISLFPCGCLFTAGKFHPSIYDVATAGMHKWNPTQNPNPGRERDIFVLTRSMWARPEALPAANYVSTGPRRCRVGAHIWSTKSIDGFGGSKKCDYKMNCPIFGSGPSSHDTLDVVCLRHIAGKRVPYLSLRAPLPRSLSSQNPIETISERIALGEKLPNKTKTETLHVYRGSTSQFGRYMCTSSPCLPKVERLQISLQTSPFD
jgi:hypothetical protein